MRMISKQIRSFTDVFCLSMDWRVSHEASLSGPRQLLRDQDRAWSLRDATYAGEEEDDSRGDVGGRSPPQTGRP